jgi:hypothetical protein
MRECKSPGHINFNFLGYGPTGTGKSRAMAHQALQIVEWCIDCAWVDSATFAGLVTACAPDASSAQRKEARAELKRLAEVEFLFFDDLGAVRFTESRITHFYALMQARYKHNLTTYFTTNYDREGIEKMLTVEGTKAEVETAGRIIRRMIGTPAEPRAHLIRFKRRRKAAKKEARDSKKKRKVDPATLTPEQRAAIWPIYLEAYHLDAGQDRPADDRWTGAEIRHCCKEAAQKRIGITDAARSASSCCLAASLSAASRRAQVAAISRYSAGVVMAAPSSPD